MMTSQASSPIRLTVIVVAALIAWLPGGAQLAHAAAGDLDPTFGTGGKVTTDFAGPDDFGNDMAIQSNGKIVVAGHSGTGSATNYDFAVARYNTDGSLDTTFGSGGKVTTDLGGFDYGVSVALQSDELQSDERIVVGGWSGSGSQPVPFDFALVRYNTDGSLDTTFGAGGKVITNLGGPVDTIFSVALQSDKKILAAGYSGTYFPDNFDFALVRYNTDGSLDTTFGTGGKVTTDLGAPYADVHSVAVQRDGKIVAAGIAWYRSVTMYGTQDTALARYNTDGSLDTTFGTGGKVISGVSGVSDAALSVAVQSDQRIVVAGYSGNEGSFDVALARFSTDGSLDATFGIGGRVITDLGGGSEAGEKVVVQPDGKILVGGYSNNGDNPNFALLRYATDGSLDTTFGVGGKVITDMGGSVDYGSGVALQIDGRIVLAGQSNVGGNPDFAVARYLGDQPPPTDTPTITPTGTATSTPTQTPTATRTPTPTLPRNVLACQRAIARAGSVYAKTVLKALQGCRDEVQQGLLTTPPAECAIEPVTAGVIARQGVRARARILGTCSDAELAMLNACAAAVDGLITADGLGGCLISTHRQAIDIMIDAQYGP